MRDLGKPVQILDVDVVDHLFDAAVVMALANVEGDFANPVDDAPDAQRRHQLLIRISADVDHLSGREHVADAGERNPPKRLSKFL